MPSIPSADMQRVCGLSGVQQKMYSKRLITLKDMEKTLQQAIREADGDIGKESFWIKSEICARVTKAICDLAFELMEEIAPPPAKGSAKAGSMIYERATAVAEALAGNSVDGFVEVAVGTHVDVAEAVLEKAGKDKAVETLSQLKVVYTAGKAIVETSRAWEKLETAGSGVAASRRQLVTQLHSFQSKIARVERSLAACGVH